MTEKSEKMKRAATTGMKRYGHTPGEWEYINDHTSRMVCLKCWAQVTVNTEPLPNEIGIGGEAIAIKCKGVSPLIVYALLGR